jgi:hypothetical protein
VAVTPEVVKQPYHYIEKARCHVAQGFSGGGMAQPGSSFKILAGGPVVFQGQVRDPSPVKKVRF